MADKILSTLVFDTVTQSYANVPPAQAPLLINDNGDLIFNTQNLSLYNSGSNNRILKNDSNSLVTDNVLVGSNNSYIYGNPHTIINACNSYISGNNLHPDGTTYQYLNSIYNSSYSCVINSLGSKIDSSCTTYISGSTNSSAQNAFYACMFGASNSTIIGGTYSLMNGRWLEISPTGRVTDGTFRGSCNNIIAGGYELRTKEANYDKQRFTGVLGTGWANQIGAAGLILNRDGLLLGGQCNDLITSQKSSIIGGACNSISGTTNILELTRFSNYIAKWKLNENNVIISSKCSKILDQVSESMILGGDSNCIVGLDFPWYYSGIDPSLAYGERYSRVICNANIIGGKQNIICTASNCSSIISSTSSKILSGSLNSIIIGGSEGTITTQSCYSIIGGRASCLNGCYSNIGGGFSNFLSGNYSFIGGGRGHDNNGHCSAIVGGAFHNIEKTSENSFIGGGAGNNISGSYSSIAGGYINCVASDYSFIGGGCQNCVTATAPYGYALGGRRVIVTHSGAAVLGDGEDRDHTSWRKNNLVLDFACGVYFKNGSQYIHGNLQFEDDLKFNQMVEFNEDTLFYKNVNFSLMPKISGIGFLLSGEPTIVYTTGYQTINGIKTFNVAPIVSGNPLITGNLSLYATTTNLASTGSTLVNSINSLSGTLTGNYVTRSNGQFTNRPNVNGTGVLLSGEVPTSQVDLSTTVRTTGNQNVSGVKAFASRPTVNGTGVFLIGQDLAIPIYMNGTQQGNASLLNFAGDPISVSIAGTQATINVASPSIQNGVYTTGNQTISGVKNFFSRVQVNGTGVLLSGEGIPSPIAIFNNGSSQGNASSLNFAGAGISVNTAGAQATITVTSSTQTTTIPTSSNSAGVSGSFAISDDYFYFCKRPNKWARTALSEW